MKTGKLLCRATAMRLIGALLFTVFLASCGNGPKEPDIHYPEGATVLTVKGMHCGRCKATIMKALSKVDGVEWAQVEHNLGQVAYSGPARRTEVVAAIRGAGYQVVEE